MPLEAGFLISILPQKFRSLGIFYSGWLGIGVQCLNDSDCLFFPSQCVIFLPSWRSAQLSCLAGSVLLYVPLF